MSVLTRLATLEALQDARDEAKLARYHTLAWTTQRAILDTTMTRLIAAGHLPDPGRSMAELRVQDPEQLLCWLNRTIRQPQWFARYHTALATAFFAALKECAP